MALAMLAFRGSVPWLAAGTGALAYVLLLVRSGALRASDFELGRRVAATFRPALAPHAPHAEGGRS